MLGYNYKETKTMHTTHAGPTPSENPPTKMGRGVHRPDPSGQKLERHFFFFKLRVKTGLIKTAKQVFTQKGAEESWSLFSEEHTFVLDEHLHHLSLVADVIEGGNGVHVWRTHEGGSKDDGQVLGVHQVVFFILCHPASTQTDGLESN